MYVSTETHMRPGWFEWLWNVSTYRDPELTASGRRVQVLG